MDEVHSASGGDKHKCRKDGLVINGVPIDGTVAFRVNASWKRDGHRTYYEIGNRVLKTMREMSPWSTLKVNPFRESEEIKSRYEATTTIGTSSASWASYSKDAWKAKLPIPTIVTPCESIRDQMDASIDNPGKNEARVGQTKNPMR